MAIVITSQPDTLAPVNKELWYNIYDNTYTSSLTNYKYVYKLNYKKEPFATTSYSVAGTYKLPPNPDNIALFSPHRKLKSYIQPTVNPFIGSYAGIANSLIRYTITYGTEYNPNYTFTSTSNSSGKLAITFASPNLLSVGDLITIDKSNKQVNIGYDGTASITQVISSYSYKTDKTYGVSSTNESGYITNLLRYQATSTELDCYNGTRQYTERTTNFSSVYTLDSSGRKFLTNYTGNKKVQLNDYETLSGILGTNPSLGLIRITMYYAGGTQSSVDISLTGNTYKRVDFGVGPANLLSIVSSYPGLSGINTCVYYTYQILKLIYSGNYIPYSELKTYVIDSTCSPYIKKRVCFLNRTGGYDYFNFTLDSKRSVNVKKEEYNKILPYNYNIGTRGSTVFSTEVEETFTMNTDWISEKECAWLEELITSPDVYILDGTNKIPIVITDTKYDNKTALRDRIFNLTVNYKLANKMNIQND